MMFFNCMGYFERIDSLPNQAHALEFGDLTLFVAWNWCRLWCFIVIPAQFYNRQAIYDYEKTILEF